MQSPRKTALLERYIIESPQKKTRSPNKSRLLENIYNSDQSFMKMVQVQTPPKPAPRLSQACMAGTKMVKLIENVNFDDDFYLNLLDWCPASGIVTGQYKSVISVDKQAELLNISKVIKETGDDEENAIAAIACQEGVAVSLKSGKILFSQDDGSAVVLKSRHCGRVGVLAWRPEGDVLASGGRDHRICLHDLRAPHDILSMSSVHKMEICGLRWSGDGRYLASGGNDNVLSVIDMLNPDKPLMKIDNAHQAAIKALAWTDRHCLYSGGGTADKRICQWSVSSQPQSVGQVFTGSQVCTLWTSPLAPTKLVSTHGYTDHHIAVWPTSAFTDSDDEAAVEPLAILSGHSQRILYAARSPCGQFLATGSGDGTVRVWNCFEESCKAKARKLMEIKYVH